MNFYVTIVENIKLFCNFAPKYNFNKTIERDKMAGTKKIKTALVSVFHKDGLDELLAKLNAEGVKFLSTDRKSVV